jgi:hypothetical protein
MSLTEIVWKDACELPLKDAAFQLWRYKDRLDDEEFGAPKFIHFDHSAEQAQYMQSIMDKIRHEHDFAHEGVTFDRLKRAQPNASDADIREAIKAAVKMMDACSKHFDANSTNFGDAIDRALAKAKAENPGFREDTWRHAGHWLVYVMK